MTSVPPVPPSPDSSVSAASAHPAPESGRPNGATTSDALSADPPPRALVRSPMSDGEWHRMHPLSPLFRGGFALVVVVGIVVTNFRDRLIYLFLPDEFDGEMPQDPVDFVIANNLILVALLVVTVGVIVLIALFYISWRFHTFRITGDDVEVRRGVLFRSHRRAPLDRVQGVNLTRPMVARLVGLAKLEVVGAGLDANVKLEYLSTGTAEAVRADILRLASGARLGEAGRDAVIPAGSRVSAAASIVGAGITGIIDGAEEPVAEPESVVHIPVGRLIASHLLSGSTVALLIAITLIIFGSIFGTPWILFGMVPAVIGFGAYWVRSITKSLRYSIAPTPSGVRITFGLFTTVTETVPPGRVHAVQISQSILWRAFGWWSVTVNRLSGRGMADTTTDQFTTVLPVGTRADVERVLRLVLPHLPESEWPLVFEHGVLGPAADDPFTNTPRRARLLRPLSWRRNGFDLTSDALFLRRGFIWRHLAIFPLARLQSIQITQGPIDRPLRVANLHAHTITGPVSGALGIVDRDAALGVFEAAEAGVITATAGDRSHRWAGADADAPWGAATTVPESTASATVIPAPPESAAAPNADAVSPGPQGDAFIPPAAGAMPPRPAGETSLLTAAGAMPPRPAGEASIPTAPDAPPPSAGSGEESRRNRRMNRDA